MRRVALALSLSFVCGIALAAVLPTTFFSSSSAPVPIADFTSASIPSSATATRTGGTTIYLMSTATTVSSTTGSSACENRGTFDGAGGGCWTFPAITQLVGSCFDLTTGWSSAGTGTTTFGVLVTSPDGTSASSTNVKATGGASTYTKFLSVGAATPGFFSAWIRDDATVPPTLQGSSNWSDASHKEGLNHNINGSGNAWRRIAFGSLLNGFVNINAAGSSQAYNVAPTLTTTATGGPDVWGVSAVQKGFDVPLAPAGSTAATIALTSSAAAKMILANGDLDWTLCFINETWDSRYLNSGSVDWYLAHDSNNDSVTFQRSNGVSIIDNWVLNIGGVAKATVSMGLGDYGTETCIRAWWRPSGNTSGITVVHGGALQSSATTSSTTTGGGLTALTSFDLGSNAGATVAGVRWTRIYSNAGATTTYKPKVVVLGDSIATWSTALTGLENKGMVGGNLATIAQQTRTDSPVIVSLAHQGDQIADQKTAWDGSVYKGQSQIKCVLTEAVVNDIIVGGITSGATLLTRKTAEVSDIHASNPSAKVICVYGGPAKGYFTTNNTNGSPTNDVSALNTYNAGLISTAGCDAVVSATYTDLSTITSDTLDAKCNTTVADGLHFDGYCMRTIYGPDAAAVLASQGCL